MELDQEHLPHFAEGEVVAGFGRGSKELGIPTANFPEDVIQKLPERFECGVYHGWAQLSSSPQVYKMTMCVGWNPYYKNTVKTMETHIIHEFGADFYGETMKIIVVGFMRPMRNYPSLDALIEAIHNDITVAKEKLEEPSNLQYKNHSFFSAVTQNKTLKDNVVCESGTQPYTTTSSNNTKQNGNISDNSSRQHSLNGQGETLTNGANSLYTNGTSGGNLSKDENGDVGLSI